MRAAEDIFKGNFYYSCPAIYVYKYERLRSEYANFYGLSERESFQEADARFLDATSEQACLARQLAILLFRETL